MEKMKRGECIVGLIETVPEGQRKTEIVITSYIDDSIKTETVFTGPARFDEIKRNLSRAVVDRIAKTHDGGRHFLLNISDFIAILLGVEV